MVATFLGKFEWKRMKTHCKGTENMHLFEILVFRNKANHNLGHLTSAGRLDLKTGEKELPECWSIKWSRPLLTCTWTIELAFTNLPASPQSSLKFCFWWAVPTKVSVSPLHLLWLSFGCSWCNNFAMLIVKTRGSKRCDAGSNGNSNSKNLRPWPHHIGQVITWSIKQGLSQRFSCRDLTLG